MNGIKQVIWCDSVIQLKWAVHKQLGAGCGTEKRLLSPPAPTAPRRDFPFLEIRIRAILSLIERHKKCVTYVCECMRGFLEISQCVCWVCTRTWQCVRGRMSSVIGRVREMMRACLKQGAHGWIPCVRIFSVNLFQSVCNKTSVCGRHCECKSVTGSVWRGYCMFVLTRVYVNE